MSNVRYLDRQSGIRVGEAGLAYLSASGRRVRHASVSHNAHSRLITRYGTFVFNGLIAPMCFAPPAAVRLPNEPELEATGAVPAAGAQARGGYDVLPTEDYDRRRE